MNKKLTYGEWSTEKKINDFFKSLKLQTQRRGQEKQFKGFDENHFFVHAGIH